MINLLNYLPLAQVVGGGGGGVSTMAGFMTALGHALGLIVIISYAYAVILIIMACVQDRQDGSWKMALMKAIGLFGAVAIANILLAVFYPQMTGGIPISFA